MVKFIIAATIAALIGIGAVGNVHTHRVCDGTSNYALCDLSLQAGKTDSDARNAGNGIFR